uniref:ARAD1C02970p n=1 Tax=Blastobotrys adeninivorans TaxID=409370 RepID=A0A060SZS5_BLAAD
MAASPLGNCAGKPWSVDDFTPCYKHWYVQSIPFAVAVLISVIVLVVSVAPKCSLRSLAKKASNDPAYQPLLASPDNEDTSAESYEDQDGQEFIRRNTNYGAIFSQKAITGSEDSSDVTSVESEAPAVDGTNKSQVVIATVVRSTGDRIRIALEALGVAAMVALSLGAALQPEISREWAKDHSNVPLVQLIFWSYALLLVCIRLAYSKSSRAPAGGLWYHSTTLYPVAWLLNLVSFRSALIHPYSTTSRNYYILSFVLNSALFYLNWTSKYGDKPAKLYVTPNIIPSNEPVASLFQLVTFSFVDPLIWKGYWNALRMNDVWELREDDHAYHILRGFRKTPAALNMVLRMVRYFKKELFLAGIYAVLYSLSTFGPALLVKAILDYVEDPSRAPQGVAWLYAIGIFVIAVLDNIIHGQALFIGRRICIRMRAIIIGEVYAKALRRKASVGGGDSSLGKKKDSASDDDGKEETDEDATQANLGSIINLMAIDAFKVSEICGYLHYFVSGTLQIIFSVVLLYHILGWSAFVGSAAIVGVMPLNYYFSKSFAYYQDALMKVTDQRVEKTNELLQSIRVIKYFGWEDKFAKGVYDVREKELSILWKRCFLWALGASIWFGVPIVITVLSFSSYTLLQGETLTSPVAFTAIALFNIMKVPMDQLADMLSNVLQAKVSIDRVEDFIREPETQKYKQLSEDQPRGPNSPTIGFENASFSWGAVSKSSEALDFRLRDLNLSFPAGKLSVVVGPTGSGKTSLLMALLGEMDLLSGRVYLPGGRSREDVKPDPNTGMAETVAYCSQQAWLLNDTVKNNILFASPYDEERYQMVIKACALQRDLEILEAGDQTEVGEKGITLSGGQKQRISLARAMYCNARHLLLDDCLSAVDSHTAAYIYEHCLSGPITENRTVILVSHNVALTISKAYQVVVLDNGRVKAFGTPQGVVDSGALGDDDLIRQSASQSASHAASQVATRVGSAVDLASGTDQSTKPKSLAKELTKKLNKAKQAGTESAALEASSSSDEEPAEVSRPPPAKLVQEESMSEGYVDRKVYMAYIRAMGGPAFWVVLALFFAGYQGTNVLQSWWIREWTVKGLVDGDVSVSMVSKLPTLSDGKKYFASSASFLANSWMSGNSNYSMDTFDETQPHFAHSTGYYLSVYLGIGVLGMISATLKELIIFWGGLKASRNMFQDLLENVLRAKMRFFDSTPIGRIMNRFSKDIEGVDQDAAPVLAGVAHCLLMCVTTALLIAVITPGFIFAAIVIMCLYSAIATFYLATSRELKRIDSVSKSPIYQHFGETLVGVTTVRAYGDQRRFVRDNLKKIDDNNRPFFYMWVTNRWLSFRVDTTGALVSFGAAAFILLKIGRIDAGLAGLSLSYALAFNDTVLWVVRLYAVLEMNMNSVERVQEYMHIESEAAPVIEDSRPPADWPSKGEIEFDRLCLRYAPDLPLVVKDASFHVKPFNKVGIVGRTGAGKSTIITALFRFLEAESGRILIDGLDIASIGLRDLRQALAIIPQDPTLFVGTIRSNLDPFNQYSDEAIFEALRRVHLISRDELEESAGESADDSEENANQFLNLESPVKEGGSNLSQGQRQLMCLARSLLKVPKVLLLDEATASIDYETDARIQKTIREEFSSTTLLTIAHRLRSIIDYDMILVMDAGQVVEYEKPHVLLQRDSIFRDMCAKSGELESLEALAKEAYKP